jgi:hypothetical protein
VDIHTRKSETAPHLLHSIKIKQQWIRGLNLRPDNLKRPEETLGETPPKHRKQGKFYKWDFIKQEASVQQWK